jgi:hypothetical protein
MNEILKMGNMGMQLESKIKQAYFESIRKPMYQHRMFQQREMNLQADYVGMDAFGANASGSAS